MPRKYSDQFKTDAVQYIALHGNLGLKECAEKLGIPYPTLYNWYKIAYGKPQNNILSEVSKEAEQEKEIKRLKRELQDTKDALEVLKRAINQG